MSCSVNSALTFIVFVYLPETNKYFASIITDTTVPVITSILRDLHCQFLVLGTIYIFVGLEMNNLYCRFFANPLPKQLLGNCNYSIVVKLDDKYTTINGNYCTKKNSDI